ncbi:hypothetical protein ACFOQM_06220 [Paenibacillus sp. GCM10012307]|uniref:Uncharacterized protein n=1 Tax=Paenibacillus roseus TaxID=2798579 RepID=A0A934MPZ8_9BACL|nr:hypothetical protein [Paenibacillus roseus]MBJ6360894.1 hypothetical protein [Paenibacillus roseus]
MTKKAVMVKAWKVARSAAAKFGGKVKQYFAEALRQAWKATRLPQPAKLETLTGSRKHKTWVARITAIGGQYKYERAFINNFKHLGHALEYTLTDGIYDVCNGGQRSFIQVSGGVIAEIEEWEIAG